MLQRGPLALALILLVSCLNGCGSRSAQSAPSAAKEIADAERSLDSAKNWEVKGEADLALAEYERAKEIIFNAKLVAAGSELSKLQNMDEEIRGKLTNLRTKKLTQPQEPRKKAAMVQIADPAEKKHKEQEAEKKKRENAAAEAKKALDESFATANAALAKKEKKEEDDAPESKTAAEKPVVSRPGKAPAGDFPEISEKSPPLDIVKLSHRDKYVFAYMQLYNKDTAGKRIMGVSVFFKDANNQPLVNPQSVAVFHNSGFKADLADPFEQSAPAITAGSHQITGLNGMQMAAVGEHERAAEIKKVSIKVLFQDGTSITETGPASADALDIVKGLKLK